jgi:hypothetical protein
MKPVPMVIVLVGSFASTLIEELPEREKADRLAVPSSLRVT